MSLGVMKIPIPAKRRGRCHFRDANYTGNSFQLNQLPSALDIFVINAKFTVKFTL